MSAYENVAVGKLKLKGKALDVKAGGSKKKKKRKHQFDLESQDAENKGSTGGDTGLQTDLTDNKNETEKLGDEEHQPSIDDHLTPAERRYIEQRQKIDQHKMAKTANKSHRDRIQDFNQYLANMSEHYDIPKVGPG